MFGLRVLSLRLLLVKQFNSNLKKSSADLGFHLNKADIKVERYCKNQGVKLHYKWYTSKTQKLSSKESIIFLLQFKCDTNYSKWFIGSRLLYLISASNVYLSPISASNVLRTIENSSCSPISVQINSGTNLFNNFVSRWLPNPTIRTNPNNVLHIVIFVF